MPIDIPAKAAAGAARAFKLSTSALKKIRVRMKPGPETFDVDADTSTRTWEFDEEISALVYDERDREVRDGPSIEYKAFLILGVDLTVDGEEEGEIEYEDRTWHISLAKTDPTKAIWIFLSEK